MLYDNKFLSEIREDASGVARLIYADWLEERGDPLGEFIRVQCRLDEGVSDLDEFTQLKAIERRLFREHRDDWIGSFADKVDAWETTRGMVSGVSVSHQQLTELGELFSHAPITRVKLSSVSGDPPVDFDFLRAHEIRSIDFHCTWNQSDVGNGIGRYPVAFSDWLKSPPESFEALASDEVEPDYWKSPLLGQLKRLEIRRELRAREWTPILRNEGLRSMCAFNFCKGANLLKNRVALLSRLESLEVLQHTGLLDTLGGLCQEIDETPLRSLAMNPAAAAPTDDGTLIKKLAASRILSKLKRLAINRTGWIGEAESVSATRLKDVFWESLEELESLSMRGCERKANDMKHLFGKGRLKNVRELFLAGVFNMARLQLNDGHLQQLAALAPASLRTLELKNNLITAKGLAALLESPLLTQLSWIDLQANELGDTAAKLLLDIEPWPQLSWLNVRANGISETLQQKLADHFGHRILVSRDIWHGQELTTAASPHG